MWFSKAWVLHTTVLQGSIALMSASQETIDLVDPLIGTTAGGHVFPGATLPFGMVKAGPDTDGENQGGFTPESTVVTGFSHMHDDGTGGGASMGNFPIFAQAACPNGDLDKCKYKQADRAISFINGTEKGSPGYFTITLNDSTVVEMTVTNRSALYRFTFDQGKEQIEPLILVDLVDLSRSRSNGSASIDPDTGRMIGNGTFAPSFGIGTYDMHFCIDFKNAGLKKTGSFMNNRQSSTVKNFTIINPSDALMSAGLWAQFDKPKDHLLVRVGISFISTQQACQNAEREQPAFDFKKTVSSARSAWADKFSVISVDNEGISKDMQISFWSGLYRSLISPQDYTGENPLWNSEEPYYDSFYCIWDSFRSVHPLFNIIDPHSQTLMLRSLIDIYRHEGWLPDCRMSLCKGHTQGGSNADVVIVDSFLKNITGVDWHTAYEALLQDAEVEPPNWDLEGRGGLESWKSLGYIPTDDFDPHGQGLITRSISRTVEYAYNDFVIAEMAKAIGRMDDHAKYIKRSRNWKNMYKDDQTSIVNGENTNYTGFLQPRYANGTWGYQNPSHCSPLLEFDQCYLNADGGETYEGSPWLYTLFAPHDMASLITTLGGADRFVSRLEFFHDSGIAYIGDEQAFLPVFLYHYAGHPGLSTRRAHYYIPGSFNHSVGGLPGNDDSGAMGSFQVLTMMGLWPVSGQDVYLINAPFFREVNITNPITGKTAIVRNVNFDPDYKRIYIQNATLNGQKWTKNWIKHNFFEEGGVLELTLGDKESDWGTRQEDLPPSISDGGPATTVGRSKVFF